MKTNNQYLIPFELCRFEIGYNKVVLLDVERADIYNLPKTSIELLKLFRKYTGKQISEKYSKKKDELEIIEEYHKFFLENEICFEITDEEKKYFPKISEEWDYPSDIASVHLIVDRKEVLSKIEIEIIKLINRFNVQALIIECNISNLNDLKTFLNSVQETSIVSIELIITNGNENQLSEITDFGASIFKINTIYVYNWTNSEVIKQDFNSIFFFEESIDQIRLARKNNYYPFLDFKLLNYMESKHHNLYYNRKIFIRDSNIIDNLVNNEKISSLSEFIENILIKEDLIKLFQKSWFITKDKIDVCSQCEYKRVCLDDRIFSKRDDGTYFTHIECSYNPFISKWKHEKDYKSLLNCGVISNSSSFIIDKKKIKSINQKIYG